MTNCRCGLRLSVADTAGICTMCTDDPLPPPPIVAMKLPRAAPWNVRRDARGRRLCRCGRPVTVLGNSRCQECHSARCKDYRERQRGTAGAKA